MNQYYTPTIDEGLYASGCYDSELEAFEERMWRKYERAHIMLQVCTARSLRSKYTVELYWVTQALLDWTEPA